MERVEVGLVGVLILVTAGLGVANPLLVKVVFDQALFVPGGPNVGLLGLLVGLMIAITILSSTVILISTIAAMAILSWQLTKIFGRQSAETARYAAQNERCHGGVVLTNGFVTTLAHRSGDNGYPQSHAHTRTC